MRLRPCYNQLYVHVRDVTGEWAEEKQKMRKKPDLLVMLAVLIGMGVLVTELAYGMMADNQPAQTQVSYRGQ
jgi:hypothetical protein